MRSSCVALLAGACVVTACRQPPREPAPQRPLRILMGLDVATLDPQVPFDDVSSIVLDNIFESLVRFDRSFRLTSGLAQRWINPDDRTWRFFLDPGARFPDGTPLKASDVTFSIERLRSLAGSQMTGFTRHIVSADVVDDLTVDVHTDVPIAILNSLAFIPIVSEAHVKGAGKSVAERPFGTGAYKLARWERGKSIVLEANEHHRPQPAIRRVEFTIRTEPDLLKEVLAERPDLTLFFPRRQVPELKKARPDLHVMTAEGLAVYYAMLNVRTQVPGRAGPNPLADRRVREALARATDRDELVRDGLLGFGRVPTQIIVPQVVGYNPKIEPPRFDPTAARELLRRAGHAGLALSLETSRGGPHRLERLLIAQWERAGIRATLRELDDASLQKAIEAGEFMVTAAGYSCTSADASEILDWGLHRRDVARGYGLGNFGGYANAEVDRLAEENLSVFDPKQRLEMLQKALVVAAADLPYLPLYVAEGIYVTSEAIDWTPPVNEEVRLEDVKLRAAAGAGGS